MIDDEVDYVFVFIFGKVIECVGQMGEDVVLVDVGYDDDWIIDCFCKVYVGDVVCVQVDFGWIVCVFYDYVGILCVQVFVGLQYGLYGFGFVVVIVMGVYICVYFVMYDDLSVGIVGRFQQYWIYIGVGCDVCGLCL